MSFELMVDSIVKSKSYGFALQIIRLYSELREQRHFDLSRQLLRSGTSVGANVEEALAGFSRKDFIAKMSLASKEERGKLLVEADKGFRDTGRAGRG